MKPTPEDKLKETRAWKATDGKIFTDLVSAIDYQERLDFYDWCARNVCIGGEWSSGMVADAVLEAWRVAPRE